ncbi:MAG: 1-acyl-sn-glycerol-3-phosphate acyltransferase [Candidatus Omnitrophica bacterium]|nr:1-acyl-sn-glycerol-3-phosphate acyltransferase [Candidatus Omnitrophota bacterium]
MLEFFKAIYYWFCTFLVAISSFIFYPCKVYGRDNVPRQGGFILASNHASNLDPMLLPVACPRQMRFMAKEELFKNPILGAVIRTGGGFPIKRGTADRGAINEFIRQLKNGYAVMIFPQGTRGGEKPQAGVGFLAATSGMPVVPTYIHGTDQVLPKGAKFPKRIAVSVTFGKPVVFSKDQAYDQIAKDVMDMIKRLKPLSA